MPKQWGRLYTGTRHHPNIRRLRRECPDSWWVWYPLLEMAIEMDNDGYVDHSDLEPMTMKQLANEVGLREKKFTETVLVMEKLKLITFFAKHLIVSSYNERQYKSDNSTERTRKYRESLKAESSRERHCDVSGTDQRQRQRQSTEKEEKTKIKDLSIDPPIDRSNGFKISNLAELWNNHAPPELARVSIPFQRTPKKLKPLVAMVNFYPEKSFWEKLIAKIHHSSFLRGKNDRGWKATFDFVVSKADEINDGKYIDQGGANATEQTLNTAYTWAKRRELQRTTEEDDIPL